MSALLVILAGCAANDPPVITRPEPLPLVLPSDEQRSQFAAAVRELAQRIERVEDVVTADIEYSAVQAALRSVADVLVLLPRGSDVVSMRDVANVIRNDAVQVGSPVMDDPARTVATKHALRVVATTLEAVVQRAYSDVPGLQGLVTDLNSAVTVIDDSQLLITQRPSLLRSLHAAGTIFQRMQEVTG